MQKQRTPIRTPTIMLMGLAEVGKSSITKYWIENKQITKEDQFSATIDYARYELLFENRKMIFYDTGGATAFLDRFTGELAEFMFTNVKAFVFLIDSIEIKDISRAKYYFDLCLKQLAQYSPSARIFLFQHKADLVPKHMRREVRSTIEEYLLSGINPGIKEENIIYYETSAFTTSIVQAIDAVMSYMLDGDLHLYHQYLHHQNQPSQTS